MRAIRRLVNEALAGLVSDFSALYSPIGRPIDPAGETITGDAAASDTDMVVIDVDHKRIPDRATTGSLSSGDRIKP
jgi:hypothetical protein